MTTAVAESRCPGKDRGVPPQVGIISWQGTAPHQGMARRLFFRTPRTFWGTKYLNLYSSLVLHDVERGSSVNGKFQVPVFNTTTR